MREEGQGSGPSEPNRPHRLPTDSDSTGGIPENPGGRAARTTPDAGGAATQTARGGNRRRIVIAALLAVAGVLAAYVATAVLLDKRRIVIHINGDDPQYVEYGDAWSDEGAQARSANLLIPFWTHRLDVTESDDVDDTRLGDYTVTYTAEYATHTPHGTATAQRRVTLRDTTPPVITLTSDPDHCTLPGHPYEEEGFAASDTHDGDLTGSVESREEDGVVHYTVTDAAGNTGTAERRIVYDDRDAPVISLVGGHEAVWYTDEGPFADAYTASDNAEGDVTGKVTVTGGVDTATPGDYQLTYTVSDDYGNTAQEQRTVHVQDRPEATPAPTPTATEPSDAAADASPDADPAASPEETDPPVLMNPSGPLPEDANTIYLTFDDGPGPYTDQLLAVLAKHDVRATFFTTSAKPAYVDEIGKEAAAGHTVAVHTSSHNYASVYASPDAYWDDFNRQNAVVKAQTGRYTTFLRFPGGSSNTVSANYCQGIMTTLTAQTGQLGYTYFDWNVSSGDAGGTTSTDTVFSNVVSQVTANHNAGKPSVVLQHDVKGFSVAAVDRIITWGLENGYNFQPLTASSLTAHQHISN